MFISIDLRDLFAKPPRELDFTTTFEEVAEKVRKVLPPPGSCCGVPGCPVCNSPKSANVSADAVKTFDPSAQTLWRRPLRDRLAQRLVDAAVEKGADRAKAEEVVADLASERPILDWLLKDGFEKFLDLILTLLKLL